MKIEKTQMLAANISTDGFKSSSFFPILQGLLCLDPQSEVIEMCRLYFGFFNPSNGHEGGASAPLSKSTSVRKDLMGRGGGVEKEAWKE